MRLNAVASHNVHECPCDSCRQELASIDYAPIVCRGNPSCALAMLALWERPWSTRALRYAYHVLYRALARGCDVLEAAALGTEHE